MRIDEYAWSVRIRDPEMSNAEREESLTLEMLEAIDASSDVTQRNLAQRMNVALGLANSYLKRCVGKGWVKIHQAPANRYLYYLTPTGFTEKGRLTGRYLTNSLDFYRKAGESCRESIRFCRRRRWNRIVLCGVSELAEIASLRAIEHDVRIAAVLDPAVESTRFLNRVVMRSLTACEPFDVCLVTDMKNPVVTRDRLLAETDASRIVVPSILGLFS